MCKFHSDKKILLGVLLISAVIIFLFITNPWSKASAQGFPTKTPETPSGNPSNNTIEVVNPYLSIKHITDIDGKELTGYRINGPSTPPPEYEKNSIDSGSAINATLLTGFPSYSWVFGCSAVSGAMIAAYYDRNGYPNMYTGPTNAGVMPDTDTIWPLWNDAYDPTLYPNNPLVASHNGIDGLAERGSIDDYWVKYGSSAIDPFITNTWIEHPWGSAIGDYMKTSQSLYGNVDGSTWFYNYNDNTKLTCNNLPADDGTYGRSQFYAARGYLVADCYNQRTDNIATGGFSLTDFQAEIDSGNPVMLNLAGHTIVGYGYEGSTIYLRDTWDNNPVNLHTMTWGVSYKGMVLQSVSVVHLVPQPVGNYHTYLPLLKKHINQAPTDIILFNNTFAEDLPINNVVSDLSTVEPNPEDTYTYSLVSGTGDTDNALFIISGNHLKTAQLFNYEVKNNFTIRVRTTDSGGLFFEKTFVITIFPAGNYPLLNGNFELGSVNWVEYSSHGWPLIEPYPDYLTVPPYDGSWAAWLGGDLYEIAYIQQPVSISTTDPYLSFMNWIASDDYCGWDYGAVLVNGSPLLKFDLCYSNNTNGWVERVLDLSAYAGLTVMIQIRTESNGKLNSNYYVDSVSFQSTPTGAGLISTSAPGTDAYKTK